MNLEHGGYLLGPEDVWLVEPVAECPGFVIETWPGFLVAVLVGDDGSQGGTPGFVLTFKDRAEQGAHQG